MRRTNCAYPMLGRNPSHLTDRSLGINTIVSPTSVVYQPRALYSRPYHCTCPTLVHTAPQLHPSPITPLDMNSLARHPLMTPATDNGACADMQHVTLDLHLYRSRPLYGPAGPAVADSIISSTTSRRCSRTPRGHAYHPDGPMFGSVIPEPDGVDHGPGAVVRAHASPGQGLNFDLASPNPAVLGWNDWRVGRVIGSAGASKSRASASTLAMGRSTRPCLARAATTAPDKLGDSPVHEFGDDGCARHSRATDKDKEEEEEDVVGLFFRNTSDDNFAPPPQSAFLPLLVRRKRWRKALADDLVRYDDDGCDGDDDVEIDEDEGPRTHVISAPVFTGARRKKRMPASSSRRKTPRPKMRCTLLKASTDEQCRDLFHDLCIEKQHPELTFNRSAEELECLACHNYL
ncbi:hypothetical protein EDB85DRAFT_2253968 [Lactarius pseudohatsudake]|nr:hypothetical protein EDB85DRAFT_2253968 [Lactarius pseudohatsudake]